MKAHVTHLVAPHAFHSARPLPSKRDTFIPAQQTGDQSSLSLQGLQRSKRVHMMNAPVAVEQRPAYHEERSERDTLEQQLQQRAEEVKAAYLRYSTSLSSVAQVETSLSYRLSQNGERYATSGRVEIDLRRSEDPQAQAKARAAVAQLKALLGARAVDASIA